MMQEWKVETVTRIFLCSGRNAGRHWASVLHPILEIRGHHL